jgi:hypothetical protein
MIAVGFLAAVALWLMSALTINRYEVDVRVLSPRHRAAFDVASLLAGLALWALIAGWRPR